MPEDRPDSKVIDEKPLAGGEGAVLRKIRSQKEGEVNNVRLLLSKKGLVTAAVFGGEVASLISPKEYDSHFGLIDSEEGFYSLSERIRLQLAGLIASS